MTEALSGKTEQERYKLFIVIALELVGSITVLLLLRNNVIFVLQSWFLFSIFLSVMLLRGSGFARIILIAAQGIGAFFGVALSVVGSIHMPFLIMFLIVLCVIPLVIVLRWGGNLALTIFIAALVLGFVAAISWVGILIAAIFFLPVTNAVRAVLLIEPFLRRNPQRSQIRRFTFTEAMTIAFIAAICIAGPILAEPAIATLKVRNHLERRYYWQDMIIVERNKVDKAFYMLVEPANDPTLKFTVTTGRGLAEGIYDDYMPVVFFHKTPAHYDQLLKGFPIEKSTQVSIPLGAPLHWNVFLQKDMTLEEINKARFVLFRLDITLQDDGSSFEDMAPLIVEILKTIREDFLSPDVYIHHNEKHVYFHSSYVNTGIRFLKNLPTIEEVVKLIKK